MKITATKDFGNTKNNKIVLPLVPEPTETATKKEDLATVDLCSDPTDADSTKVPFAFKTLNGTAESPRDLIDWRKNVERTFTGLNSTTGSLQHQMMQQFCRGTTLSTCNSNVNQLCRNGKAADHPCVAVTCSHKNINTRLKALERRWFSSFQAFNLAFLHSLDTLVMGENAMPRMGHTWSILR